MVPVGVDTTVFRPPERSRCPGRVVCIASADVPLKGLPVLFEAVARADAVRELVVVGRPAARTRAVLRAAGIADRVRFVAGLDDAALAALLASAELAVVPSLYEGFSLPAVEAMACGTPVVASAVGALPELVGADGRCGALVPPGDAPALADALDRLLGAQPWRARMGEAAARTALERYSWESVARATAAVYEQVARPAATTDPTDPDVRAAA